MLIKRHPTVDEIQFCELVGGLSEAIEHSSYNDETLLTYLLDGTLNDAVLREEDARGVERHTCKPVDFDYEAELLRLMEVTGGWPVNWMEPVAPLSGLPDRYRDIFIRAGKEYLLTQWSK